jgi:peptidoglycan/xylan/chitin deacetylase (PgdA/CDA1 family)
MDGSLGQARVAPGWRAWRPVPAARASIALHGIGAGMLAVQPALWAEVLGALALNHAVLAAGMRPRSALLGPNLRRLAGTRPEVALTFDDGPDPEVTPRILDLLDAARARASFFVIGRRAARHPALLREMLRRGHSVENHTERHPIGFAAWGPWRQRAEIAAAQATIAGICGRAPRFFRPPAGLRNPLLDPALAAEGLVLASWTRRGYDTVTGREEIVLRRMTGRLAARDILMLHDAGSRPGPDGRPVVLSVLPRLLGALGAAGLRSVSLDEAVPAAAPEGAAA